MEIIDIQEVKGDRIHPEYEITFATESGYECAKIILSKSDMQYIGKYCQKELSYGAQQRKSKSGN